MLPTVRLDSFDSSSSFFVPKGRENETGMCVSLYARKQVMCVSRGRMRRHKKSARLFTHTQNTTRLRKNGHLCAEQQREHRFCRCFYVVVDVEREESSFFVFFFFFFFERRQRQHQMVCDTSFSPAYLLQDDDEERSSRGTIERCQRRR